MKKLIIICCAIIALLILVTNIWGKGWIFFHDGPYRGKVVDADTGQPIAGAAVAGMWRLETYGGPGGPVGVYCDAKEALTDKYGEFTVPKAFCFNLWPFTKMGMAEFVIFKTGYLGYPPVGATFAERKTRMPDFNGYEFLDKKEAVAIRLGKPETFDERRSTLAAVDISGIEKVPLLQELVNKERRLLGFDR